MYSYLSFNEPVQQLLPYTHSTQDFTPMSNTNTTNKFVYVKQNFAHNSIEAEPVKVLVNPNFNKKVFVNPNFNGNIGNVAQSTSVPKIHINPNVQNLKFGGNECKNINKIHVNPNVLRNVPITKNGVARNNSNKNVNYNYEKEVNRTIISTRTKLVRSVAKNTPEIKIRKRRSSIRSQFKIIKSSLLAKSVGKSRADPKYKLVKSCYQYAQFSKDSKVGLNKFKLDNRSTKSISTNSKMKKYVYVNRFFNISDIAKSNLLKQNKNKLSTVNISGVLYKKSANCLKIISTPYKKTNNVKKIQETGIRKSKYKLMRKSLNVSIKYNRILKQSKVVRPKIVANNIAKLRVCNIPCPYYRKFGKCKGRDNGKCNRKHDPDQIALCTKFLQGACVDNKCLLSHNVSPEKMPTCKFYLEGSCSKEDCPYLHVRISPKADVCKDFLEGFCKKAAECGKRHQFLCPDYEKNGSCQKQRCPYPHGKMVRKYSVFTKNKFAKKSSDNCATAKIDRVVVLSKNNNLNCVENYEANTKPRYYVGQTNLDNEENQNSDLTQNNSVDRNNDQEHGIHSRPKLGKLPSFIAFENN